MGLPMLTVIVVLVFSSVTVIRDRPSVAAAWLSIGLPMLNYDSCFGAFVRYCHPSIR